MLDSRRIFTVEKPTFENLEEDYEKMSRIHDGKYLELFYNTILLGNDITLPHHLRPIVAALGDNNIRKLLILILPGSGKSLLMTEIFPLFELGLNPNTTIMSVSGAEAVLIDSIKAVANIIENSQFYHAMFPNIKPDRDLGFSPNTGLYVQRTNENNIISGIPTPSYFVLGSFSHKIVGKHAEILLFDDLENDEIAASPDLEAKLYKIYLTTLLGRQMPGGSRLICIGRRWSKNDFYSRLIKSDDWLVMTVPAFREDREEGDNSLWFDVKIPPKLPCVFNNYKASGHAEEIKVVYGQSDTGFFAIDKSFSGKYSEALEAKKGDPDVFKTTYQSDPTDLSTSVFSASDFVYFNPPPNLINGRGYPDVMDLIGKADQIIQCWDTAYTAETTNDPSACFCYDPETEVLTKRGWLFFSQLTALDEVATRNPTTKEFEWQKPSQLIVEDFKGDLIHFKAQCLDLLVTPNHNMVARKYGNSDITHRRSTKEKFIRADELAEDFSKECIPVTSNWIGTKIDNFLLSIKLDNSQLSIKELPPSRVGRKAKGIDACLTCNRKYYKTFVKQRYCSKKCADIDANVPIYMEGDDYCAFMGMYLSEGSISARYQVDIAQSESGAGYETYKGLLTKIFKIEPPYIKSWRISSALLVNYLRVFGKSHEKFVPEIIKNATPDQIRIFLHYYYLGDGSHSSLTRRVFYTSSKKMADDLQELIQKAGYNSGVHLHVRAGRETVFKNKIIRSNYDQFYVTQYQTKGKPQDYIKIRAVKKVQYSGKVYCATVPNHTLYVRRNGYAVWCGNTLALIPCKKYHKEGMLNNIEVPFHYDVLVLDEYYGRVVWGDLAKVAVQVFNKWQPNYVIIEKATLGIPLIDHLKQFGISTVGVSVNTNSKRTRAMNGAKAGSAQAWFRQGRVLFPVPSEEYKWVEELEKELINFTGASKERDDRVDALVHGINYAIDLGIQSREFPEGWRSEEDIERQIKSWGQTKSPLDGLGMILSQKSTNPFGSTCASCRMHDPETRSCTLHKIKVSELHSCSRWEPLTSLDKFLKLR